MVFQIATALHENCRIIKIIDEVVTRTGRNPASVRKAALRLGVKLAKQIASDRHLAGAKVNK